MVNYQNGKIYKIEDLTENMCYIGSTTKERLCQRMSEHRRQYKQWQTDNITGFYTVFEIFEKYSIQNCKITLIEFYPCLSKDELFTRESHFIKAMQCVNKVIPNGTQKEYRIAHVEERKIYNQKYREDNKDKIKAWNQQMTECVCGSIHTKHKQNRHELSQKHLRYIASQNVVV